MLKKISVTLVAVSIIGVIFILKHRAQIKKLNQQAAQLKTEIQAKRQELARIEIYESSESLQVKEYYDGLMDNLFIEAEIMGFKTTTHAAGQQDYERIENYITASCFDGVRQMKLTSKIIKSGITDPTIMFYFIKKIANYPIEIKNIEYNKNGTLKIDYLLFGK